MKPTKKLAITTAAAAALTLGFVGTASAGAGGNKSVGQTNAAWSETCETVTVRSSKDLSNIVYMLDGVENRIEFTDGTHTMVLPGEITELWVKAGNNKSGHGPGFGDHYIAPDACAPTHAPTPIEEPAPVEASDPIRVPVEEPAPVEVEEPVQVDSDQPIIVDGDQSVAW